MTIRTAAFLGLVAFASACSEGASPSEPATPATTAAAPAAEPMTHGDMPMGGAAKPPTTDAEIVASAMSAAPEAVSRDATVLGFDEKMQPRTLRTGTNGWTCMPDMPHSPGTDPMCVDRNGMAWLEALLAHTNPPAGKVGFAYMLMGGSDASNTDPWAMKPAGSGAWVDTGPHVMVLNVGDPLTGFPTTPDNPKAPYVMFPNTPYAHLMLPVR